LGLLEPWLICGLTFVLIWGLVNVLWGIWCGGVFLGGTGWPPGGGCAPCVGCTPGGGGWCWWPPGGGGCAPGAVCECFNSPCDSPFCNGMGGGLPLPSVALPWRCGDGYGRILGLAPLGGIATGEDIGVCLGGITGRAGITTGAGPAEPCLIGIGTDADLCNCGGLIGGLIGEPGGGPNAIGELGGPPNAIGEEGGGLTGIGLGGAGIGADCGGAGGALKPWSYKIHYINIY